jgi:hypothetical protein
MPCPRRSPSGQSEVGLSSSFELCSSICLVSPPTCRCTVINRAVLRLNPELEKTEWNTQLYTPPNIVSAQEKSQIEERIEGWVDNLVVSLYQDGGVPSFQS